jgi:sugar phosphate isomerase/epimerase
VKLALCNEVLAPLSFERQCEVARLMGYEGLELAPFTVSEAPETMTSAQARSLRSTAAQHGMTITGLHWLLVKPEGLSITSPDHTVWQRTVDVMRHLCQVCADVGGSYLVHGSPGQRQLWPGQTATDALQRATQAWALAAEAAGECGVTYCIEPLSSDQTPLINTLEQAAAVVREVGHPALKTMLDTSSAGRAEQDDLPTLIARWLPTGLLAHVQLNDPNRRAPGQGAMHFAPIVQALHTHGYSGVLAMEPFEYVPDGPGCAAWSAGYVRGLLEALT